MAARRYVILGVLLIAALGATLAIERPWTSCPSDWSDAARVGIGTSSGDVTLDGTLYRVGGSALLDYMPRGSSTPLDRLMYALRGPRHPLVATASISAASRETLGEPVFTCVRVTRAGEVWARRPTTYGTQSLSDGFPPGAPPPARNEAWRLAVTEDGPDWADGDPVDVELWAIVGGRHYVFVLAPFTLMKGG
jgi:hypothetical protein